MTTTEQTIEYGDFISVPAWQTFGMVIGFDHDAAQLRGYQYGFLVQEHPDQKTADCKYYWLNDGQFEVES